MEQIIPLLLDLTVILTIISCIVAGMKKGFAATFVSLVGFVVSFFAALILSRAVAEVIYFMFVDAKLYQLFESSLATSAENTDIAKNILEAINTLPEYLINMLEFDTGGIAYSLDTALTQSAETMIKLVIEGIIAPVIKGLLRGILFIVIFFICNLIAKIVISLLKGIKYIPLIGTINSVLGGFAGIIYGVIYNYIIAAVCLIMIFATNNSIPYLTSEAVENSRLFSRFTNIGSIVGIYNNIELSLDEINLETLN